jgi:N-acyl homoserine lactone hydrolase
MHAAFDDKKTPRVHVLLEGSLVRDKSGNILDAHSSVTLVLAGEVRLLIDTGAPGDEDRILSALAGLGLCGRDITHVIHTHAHRDHAGCDHLFEHAEVLMHPDELKAEGSWDAGEVAARAHPLTEGPWTAPGIGIIYTPGHTPGSVSILITGLFRNAVESGIGRVICAGDALPTRDNFRFRLPPAINYDRPLALASMERIMAMAEWIIPGHDAPIKVLKGG